MSQCPSCDTRLEVTSCALLDCLYRIEGMMEGDNVPSKYPEVVAPADKVTKFNAQRQADWRYLQITVRFNP